MNNSAVSTSKKSFSLIPINFKKSGTMSQKMQPLRFIVIHLESLKFSENNNFSTRNTKYTER